jgi:(S)-2-hydroxy-acid oxidase
MLEESEKRNLLNVDDYQVLAKTKLPHSLYEYLASGTADATTLRENRDAFARWYLRPRAMRPVGRISTRMVLFGQGLSMPVFCSPAGVHALCHPDGECATARVCQDLGLLFGLSQHATKSIEQVAAAAPQSHRYYQAYILKDRSITARLVQRAIQAGYSGIFLTVDSVRFGYREADARNGCVCEIDSFFMSYLGVVAYRYCLCLILCALLCCSVSTLCHRLIGWPITTRCDNKI